MGLDEDIREAERKLEKLRAEKSRLEGLPEDKQLAEILHEHLCRSNHDDQCSWFYESWNKPGSFYAHTEYLNKAKKILEVSTLEQAVKILNCL